MLPNQDFREDGEESSDEKCSRVSLRCEKRVAGHFPTTAVLPVTAIRVFLRLTAFLGPVSVPDNNRHWSIVAPRELKSIKWLHACPKRRSPSPFPCMSLSWICFWQGTRMLPRHWFCFTLVNVMENPLLIFCEDCAQNSSPPSGFRWRSVSDVAMGALLWWSVKCLGTDLLQNFDSLDASERCPMLCRVKDSFSVRNARQTHTSLHRYPQHARRMWMVVHPFVRTLCLPYTTSIHVARPLHQNHRLSQAHGGFPWARWNCPEKMNCSSHFLLCPLVH
jgi:hypothetical protein